jgi:SynChlorMet cassette radical SAM/SPASM protein ScmE
MDLMKTPRTVELAITSRCNLRCKYCSFFSSEGDVGQELSTESWLSFFEELNQCGVMKVVLQGGEPFIRQDLHDIVQGIVDNRMRFSILSNGTLISEDTASFLASTGRCEIVQISVDGPCPAIHDTCRGDGTFVKAVAGIRLLQKYKISVTIRVTIHRQNYNSLKETAEFLLNEVGVQSFSTNSASHFGLCRENAKAIQLTPAERSAAMQSLLELDRKYTGRIQATAGPLAEAKQWLTMEQAHKSGENRLPGKGYLTGCGCVFSKISVRADGVMVPCLLMSHVELGRINKDSLATVWQHHSELQHLRDRRQIPLSSFSQCSNCNYNNYCTGNCPASAHTVSGTSLGPSPDGCLKKFLDSGGQLPIIDQQDLTTQAG